MSKSTLPKPKRKRDKEASKQALLNAAIQVFSEHGFDAATTKRVAECAGVSEALIQRYFSGKSGLLIAIMRDFATTYDHDQLAHLPFADSLEKEIQQIWLQSCQKSEDMASFMRVVLSRAIVDNDVGKELGTTVHARRIPLIKTRLLHYQAKGLIRPEVNLDAIAYSISSLGFTLGFMSPKVFQYDPKHLNEFAKELAHVISRGAGENSEKSTRVKAAPKAG